MRKIWRIPRQANEDKLEEQINRKYEELEKSGYEIIATHFLTFEVITNNFAAWIEYETDPKK